MNHINFAKLYAIKAVSMVGFLSVRYSKPILYQLHFLNESSNTRLTNNSTYTVVVIIL